MLASPRLSPVPLAAFRILIGLCLVVESTQLIGDRALWFDVVPHVERGAVPMFALLQLWRLAAIGIVLGCFTRAAAVVNYACCVYVLGLRGMPGNYEYHPDNLYLILSLLLVVLPVSRALSLDAAMRPPARRSVGPLGCIALSAVAVDIYLDSAIWKLSSRMWMEGLGYWTPATQPLHTMAKFPWTLESKALVVFASHLTVAYELLFVVLIWFRRMRWPLLACGLALHAGIGTALPLPIFGLLMIALLAGLLPMRASDEEVALGPEPLPTGLRFGLGAFAALWLSLFGLGVFEPIQSLVRHGVGGVEGGIGRPWHATSTSRPAWLAARASAWGYQLFGFRTHPIFLDSQFANFDVETRLRCVRPGDDARDGGTILHAPTQNRRWLVWNNRMVWPGLPLEVVEEQLLRVIGFHQGREDLDLVGGVVLIEQRSIDVPTTEWKPGQLAANLRSTWRTVGEARGALGELRITWRTPAWRSRAAAEHDDDGEITPLDVVDRDDR